MRDHATGRTICETVSRLVERSITISDDWLHGLKGCKLTLDICIIQEFSPDFMLFSAHTCKAITWFYLTDIRICNNFTLKNKVLIYLFPISFSL